VIGFILHLLKTGSRWCDLPPEYRYSGFA